MIYELLPAIGLILAAFALLLFKDWRETKEREKRASRIASAHVTLMRDSEMYRHHYGESMRMCADKVREMENTNATKRET
jgi:hypothetical protein